MRNKSLIYFIFVIFLSSFVYSADPIFDDIYHYYNFSQTSGQLLDSAGTLDSTAVDVFSQSATGIDGGAWDFERDSTDEVTFPGGGVFIPHAVYNWTINAWVKREDLTEGARSPVIWSDNGNARHTVLYWRDVNDMIARVTTTGDTQVEAGLGTTNGITNDWLMFTGRYNGTYASVYINGSFIASSAITGLSDTNGGSAYIGFFANVWFDGLIDELGIWNRSLSDSEILSLWNGGTGLFLSSLDITPPINSSWNVTSNNTIVGETSSVWNIGGKVNITTDLLTITVITDENSNGSCRLDVEQNYTQMVAADSNFKFATTETTDHAYTISENISQGDHCLYCSFIDSSGNEPSGGTSSSGCLNLNLDLETNLIQEVDSCYLNSSLGGCFAINWSLAYDQINWSDNATIHSGNYSWNFTELNISPINSFIFNFTNNGTTNITVRIRLNTSNPSIWQLFYNNSINISNSTFVGLINLTTNTSRFINLTLDLYNISSTYTNWTLNKSTAEWSFNYTINITIF